jgi:hypothetical protein
VGRQERDEAQRSIRFSYSFGKRADPVSAWFTGEPVWLAMIGTLLLARIAMLRSPSKPRW